MAKLLKFLSGGVGFESHAQPALVRTGRNLCPDTFGKKTACFATAWDEFAQRRRAMQDRVASNRAVASSRVRTVGTASGARITGGCVIHAECICIESDAGGRDPQQCTEAGTAPALRGRSIRVQLE
jgi:hypothetical protein